MDSPTNTVYHSDLRHRHLDLNIIARLQKLQNINAHLHSLTPVSSSIKCMRCTTGIWGQDNSPPCGPILWIVGHLASRLSRYQMPVSPTPTTVIKPNRPLLVCRRPLVEVGHGRELSSGVENHCTRWCLVQNCMILSGLFNKD